MPTTVANNAARLSPLPARAHLQELELFPPGATPDEQEYEPYTGNQGARAVAACSAGASPSL